MKHMLTIERGRAVIGTTKASRAMKYMLTIERGCAVKQTPTTGSVVTL